MQYEVKEHGIAPVQVMSIRVVVPMDGSIGTAASEIFDRLYGHLTQGKAVFTDPPFILYHPENMGETQADMEVCAPVAELLPDEPDIKGRTVDGAEGLMLRHVHKGPYESLGAVYPDIMRWIDENGWEWDTSVPMRELYLNDPDRVPPEELLTEIICPVKKI